jgi:hypothetical protein
VLDLVITHSNKVRFTDIERQQLKQISAGRMRPAEAHSEEVIAA